MSVIAYLEVKRGKMRISAGANEKNLPTVRSPKSTKLSRGNNRARVKSKFPELKPSCSSLRSILFHPETQPEKFSLRTRSSRIHYGVAKNRKEEIERKREKWKRGREGKLQ